MRSLQSLLIFLRDVTNGCQSVLVLPSHLHVGLSLIREAQKQRCEHSHNFVKGLLKELRGEGVTRRWDDSIRELLM
jgi:hypothetical protein